MLEVVFVVDDTVVPQSQVGVACIVLQFAFAFVQQIRVGLVPIRARRLLRGVQVTLHVRQRLVHVVRRNRVLDHVVLEIVPRSEEGGIIHHRKLLLLFCRGHLFES